MPRDFIDLNRLNAVEARDILGRVGKTGTPLAGKTLALVFEKPSTRTRVSFELAMKQLGGDVVVLSAAETQLGRGETVADTARVLSRYVDGIMVRTDAHDKLLDLAAYADVPVINGLTDRSHPCQVMADILTLEQKRETVRGKTVAWVGDGNNVCTSWIEATPLFEFALHIATPPEYAPPADVIAAAREKGGTVRTFETPAAAVTGANVVTTDTWASMGDEDAEARRRILAPFQVDEALMKQAGPAALFMHCLPAHRGDEMTEEVIDGPRSVVFDEAENRLHVQKGILSWCFDV